MSKSDIIKIIVIVIIVNIIVATLLVPWLDAPITNEEEQRLRHKLWHDVGRE